jgi:hypothetical protein
MVAARLRVLTTTITLMATIQEFYGIFKSLTKWCNLRAIYIQQYSPKNWNPEIKTQFLKSYDLDPFA